MNTKNIAKMTMNSEIMRYNFLKYNSMLHKLGFTSRYLWTSLFWKTPDSIPFPLRSQPMP